MYVQYRTGVDHVQSGYAKGDMRIGLTTAPRKAETSSAHRKWNM